MLVEEGAVTTVEAVSSVGLTEVAGWGGLAREGTRGAWPWHAGLGRFSWLGEPCRTLWDTNEHVWNEFLDGATHRPSDPVLWTINHLPAGFANVFYPAVSPHGCLHSLCGLQCPSRPVPCLLGTSVLYVSPVSRNWNSYSNKVKVTIQVSHGTSTCTRVRLVPGDCDICFHNSEAIPTSRGY
jgi:hypothetical protein